MRQVSSAAAGALEVLISRFLILPAMVIEDA
jgi:hypothetical protein